MNRLMTQYTTSILTAAKWFPLAAIIIAGIYVPIYIKKHGRLSITNLVSLLAFSFYFICIFALTNLPLPSIAEVLEAGPREMCLIPGFNLFDGLQDFGFNPHDLYTLLNVRMWFEYIFSSYFFVTLANIMMLVPCGIMLRVLFKMNIKQTIAVTFLFSLFIELIQLSGLFGIYPYAYRCADVNDLIANTLGGIIGYAAVTVYLQIRLAVNSHFCSGSFRSGMRTGATASI